MFFCQQSQGIIPNQVPMQKIHVQNIQNVQNVQAMQNQQMQNQVVLPPNQSPMQQMPSQSTNQQQTPQQMNATTPTGPPQFLRAARPQWQGQPGQPQRQLIHLDAQTHGKQLSLYIFIEF